MTFHSLQGHYQRFGKGVFISFVTQHAPINIFAANCASTEIDAGITLNKNVAALGTGDQVLHSIQMGLHRAADSHILYHDGCERVPAIGN